MIGEEAHIRSARQIGPRYDPQYPREKLDTYGNLVLLCPTHHAIVDKDEGAAWPTDAVENLKATHERAVDEATSATDLAVRDLEELLVAQIANWEIKARLATWRAMTSHLNNVYPQLRQDEADGLFELGAWLLERRWPDGYPRIVYAFENFRQVLTCLLELIGRSFEAKGQIFELPREHKRIGWNASLYTELISDFNVKANVVWLLTMELTRAANLIISAVAAELDPLYRLTEGYVLLQDGDAFWGIELSRLQHPTPKPDSVPQVYSLQALIDRTRVELDGGDPRSEPDIDLYAVDVSEWARPTD
ncbi:hypothetical protein [Microbacterium pygmaeum]|uniref:hypothetical protein n=1 Tax=Microbacterium pygmaeum TaxID=370764 RepID=UPI0012F8DE56|nr:hypothetical protein [Microbacterium pygmaeum]